jgi:hypothetical protein
MRSESEVLEWKKAKGRSDQRFGPNLLLDEANFKITEAGISAYSDALIIGFPVIRNRNVDRVELTHRK